MNADRLLELYDKVAEAPDAIERLRRFVLDLAVRGKLAEQNPMDEPASELLKRIASARADVPKSGRGGKKKLVDASLTELPFALPAGWSRTLLSDLVRVVNGRAYKKSELLSEGTPVLRVGNLFTSNHWYYSNLELEDDKYCDEGDLIYAWSASFGPFIWDGPRAIYHYHIWKLPLFSEADLDKQFLYLFLLQKTREIKDAGHGVSMVHMTKEKMEQLAVPLPPLAEQTRIVTQVEELMALLDRLEAARTARETTRDRLTAASLIRLTATDTDPDAFPDHARFALNALPVLTARSEQIKILRRTILDLAIRGRLVNQDCSDEPASALLERIGAEREHLLSSGRIKKQKPIAVIGDAEPPYEIPANWQWARFNQIAAIQSNLVDPIDYREMPHVAPNNIEGWTARLLPYSTVKEDGVTSGKHLFSAGSILYSKIRPNLAKVAVADFDGLCSADMYPILAHIERPFLVAFMITPAFVDQSVSEENRVAMPKINQAALSNILVPIPPQAEQQRIVAKLEELMPLCDRLESLLRSAGTTRARLLEAALYETLDTPSGEREAA